MGHKDTKKAKNFNILFAPLWILAYTAMGYFAPFLILMGPLAGVAYFVVKGRIDQLAAAENREMLGHTVIAMVGGVVVGVVIANFIGRLRGFAFAGDLASHSILIGTLVGLAFFVLKGRIYRKRHIDQLASAENRNIYSQALISLLRGAVVGTVGAAALFAPMRGLAFLATKFSGIDFLNEFFTAMSANGVIDAWLGLIGVSFPIPAGFAAWRQGLRIKTQIENIPTGKAHSAALGLAEFKGVARAIADEQKRKTEIIVNGKKQAKVPEALMDDGAATPILYERWVKRTRRGSKVTQISSRFYLEDNSGRILVDPRGVWFWDGKVHFFSPSARSIYLKKRLENRSKVNAQIKIRRLNPGDEIYLIGAVEELEDAAPTATDSQRLVVRPSSTLKSTNLLRRIILGHRKQTHRTDIYDVFFLTDVKDLNAARMLSEGIGKIWLWVAGIVLLSVPLLVEYRDKLLDW